MDVLKQIKSDLLKVTTELISPCSYCTLISTDPESKAPIQCTKFSGSSYPINVNAAACLSCREYEKPQSRSHPRHAS
ncbi:hypothetical protein [Paenibacillus gansuensis]|uniref:Uncharacterized protein n=1 Tax=Paenibacillus gansuensis TaxID=306542 RepID=A0ABW5PAU9_9BACL